MTWAHLVPTLVVTLVALMPIIAAKRAWGHRFNLGLTFGLLLAIGALTGLALREDAQNAEFQVDKELAETDAERVLELAARPSGIPPVGALSLLRTDPLTQGPRLFASNCSTCHRYDGHDGLGNMPADEQSAPDLVGYAGRSWVAGLLDPDRVGSLEYFGGTDHARGRMVRVIERRVRTFDEQQKIDFEKILKAISAEAALPRQAAMDASDAEDITEAHSLMAESRFDCQDCHFFQGEGARALGPDLTGWGSREWMFGMLQNPAHEDFYRENNDRMPAFGEDELLSQEQIVMIVDWLREDWDR